MKRIEVNEEALRRLLRKSGEFSLFVEPSLSRDESHRWSVTRVEGSCVRVLASFSTRALADYYLRGAVEEYVADAMADLTGKPQEVRCQ